MGSNIFNFDLEVDGNQSLTIDLDNGCFTEDENKKVIYHFPVDTVKVSDRVLTVEENNLKYKGEIVGVISFPKSCSINLSKIPDVELVIREVC